MPGKNTVKTYFPNCFYHIYNRGVEKRSIYQNSQDYQTFLSYLKLYLSPPPETKPLQHLNNFAKTIELVTYCLMPNHFHLLVKQHTKFGINLFMQSLNTKYSMYFNKKYKRVGSLFQSRYKAVLIETDEQLLYLTKYIHLNPTSHNSAGSDPADYPYSSYKNYLGQINQPWVKPAAILNLHENKNPKQVYKSFVEEIELPPIPNYQSLIIEDI